MKKKIEQVLYKLHDKDINGGETLFNFVVILGIISNVIGTISCIIEDAGIESIIVTSIGAILLVVIYFMGHRNKHYDYWSFVLILMLNVLVIPTTFFASAGYHGGMPIWMVFMFVCIFYLLKGKYLLIATFITIITFNGCLFMAHKYPQLVNEFNSDDSVFFDILLACMLISAMLCTFMKIQSAINDMEKETNKKQKMELEDALKAKSLFLANMSHEIRTPINTIIGLNEMTLREDISTEVEENSINIERASRMLLSLINDVLDLSKAESGKMELIEAEYSLGDLFSEIVDMNWNKAQQKGLDFHISVSPDMPSKLYGDEAKIKQIMSNLLSNAIKYTMEGSVDLSAYCDRINDRFIELRIDVNDTGIGIRNEDLGTLFDDFKRVNVQDTKGIEGTGLGLSICKQLVELMDGSIEVDSIYRKGSTFSAIVPQRVIDASPIGEIKIGNYSDISKVKYTKKFEAPGAHVLVVDDNEMNLLVAKKLLRDTRVKLDVAKSGEECLQLTQKRIYDIIFMDHLMPNMDGVETLEKIREQINGFCRRTPVIALTANVTLGAKERYKKFGFNDFLPKPITGELIEKMLLQMLPPDKIEYQANEFEGKTQSEVRLINQTRKRKIIVATDNSSDLPENIIRQLGIGIINHYVVTDNGKFQDKKEIYTDCIVEHLKKGKSVLGTAPKVEEYEEFFGDMLEQAEQVLYITISSKIYNGYEKASEAAKSFAHVSVYDSYQVAGGLGLLTIEAAKMAIEEFTSEEIIEKLDELRPKVSGSFLIDKADQLYKNGLMPLPLYKLSKLFNIHFLLKLKDGNAIPTKFFSGNVENAYLKYVKSVLKNKRPVDDTVFFEYSECSVDVREKLKNNINVANILEMQSSASITAHCGLGCVGVFFIQE